MTHAEKFWDKLAKDIDPKSDVLDQDQLRMVKKISHYVKASDTLLDYGCARGGIALGLADKVKEVQGIDISSKMITIAQKRVEARNIENAHFFQSKINDKRLEPQSFHVIIALNVFHLVESPDLVMKRLHALLKPGGLLISLTPCLGETKTLLSVLASPVLHLMVKTGWIPSVSFLKLCNLEAHLGSVGFEITEKKIIQEKIATSYFLIGKKSVGKEAL